MIDTNDQKEKNKEILNNIIYSQKESKKSILALMQSFAESTDPIDIRFVDEIKNIFEELKTSLDICNNSINLSEKMLQEIDNSDLFNTIVLDNFTNATIDPQTDTIDENNQVGIIICKQDNKYVIKYCSNDRIIAKNTN